MELIVNNDDTLFVDLICFQSEVTNPQQMKKEIDKLVDILNKMKIKHKNKVITKVIGKNVVKKTMTMKIHIPIITNENVHKISEKYPMYKYQKEFLIKKGYMISISNDMAEFKKAVELFISKTNNNENADIQNYDVSNNNIIEVSKIGYDGSVLGFDLYMETL